MFYTIYKITNKINQKFYIGKHQTDNLNDGYMGSGKLIRRAINKYGIENFQKEILFVFDNEDDMNQKEKELVVVSDQTYNLCPGGQGGWGYINIEGKAYKFTKEDNSKGGKKGIKTLRKNLENENFREDFSKKVSKGLQKIYKENPEKLIARGKSFQQCNSKVSIEKKKKTWKKTKRGIGEKNSQFGTCWITNGTENKKIRKEELDIWISSGFSKGRKIHGTVV